MEIYRFSKEINTELRSLRKSNNYRGIIGIIYDFLIIALAIYLGQISWWFYPVAVLIIGARQRALATILHDAAHSVLAKNRKINYFLGTYLSGYLIGQEYYNYRDSHCKGHHPHLGDKEKDPDYVYHLEAGLYRLKNRNHFFVKYVLKPLFLLNIVSYSYYVFKHRMLQFKNYPRQYINLTIYWVLILSFISIFGFFTEFLLFWIIPYFTAFMVIGWFIEMAEHYPLVDKYNNSLYMTRNRFSHWLEAFFLSIHAENYHLTHHLALTIPYWNVPKAHKAMMKDPNYKRANEQMGGVFISSNKNTALIWDLLKNNKLPNLKNEESEGIKDL
ncbi:guanitoxin biosynthesis L-arginine gamma (S) hydroxylase [Shouchella patagoniensis]|uniref:guanitoxin biosynthesis L-arginine gamma (S) hydroxylase n=1 Tax=Shouchella patagoniensis TaxID=228576 RepID=UPI000994D0D7|nr:guanitoxin biosynthesis L-arginine gamma (S) hydroxylase [Shouchella patagoniensis]